MHEDQFAKFVVAILVCCMVFWNICMQFLTTLWTYTGFIIYTNKTGDCLFICSLMDGQTARPNGLKFGG